MVEKIREVLDVKSDTSGLQKQLEEKDQIIKKLQTLMQNESNRLLEQNQAIGKEHQGKLKSLQLNLEMAAQEAAGQKRGLQQTVREAGLRVERQKQRSGEAEQRLKELRSLVEVYNNKEKVLLWELQQAHQS